MASRARIRLTTKEALPTSSVAIVLLLLALFVDNDALRTFLVGVIVLAYLLAVRALVRRKRRE